jgi:hypothetical protein
VLIDFIHRETHSTKMQEIHVTRHTRFGENGGEGDGPGFRDGRRGTYQTCEKEPKE